LPGYGTVGTLWSQIWQKPESCQRIRWKEALAGLVAASADAAIAATAARKEDGAWKWLLNIEGFAALPHAAGGARGFMPRS